MTSAPEPTVDATHVAVLGMACRFPGARDTAEFWENLAEGIETIRKLSREDLLEAGESEADISDPAYVRAYGRLDDIGGFDAEVFGYSPRDATLIDPQQRQFLECTWEALEDAGYDPTTFPGSIGVYSGCSPNTYATLLQLRAGMGASTGEDYQLGISAAPDHLTSRVSYKLGLTGPSVTVLATCATSLVAIHQACQALIGGECDLALAGGVSIRVPTRGYRYEEGGVLSPDGRVRTFDADAQGMVGGDGVGVVALKLLEDALADGDNIRAVVRGSAVNNLGADRVGYTAPGVDGQAEVIRKAQVVAAVDPATIGYVEAHGTATRIGDPIEVAALTKAFRAGTARRRYCAIGSAKSNIGHTNAAAGVAGFIKAVLALEHRLIPPSLNYTEPNPQIDFEASPFFVNDELRAWPSNGTPRRAGVSSFGLGGTNAHVVLEEAPATPGFGAGHSCQLLVLSARTPTALDSMANRLAEHLRRSTGISLADVAYTLQVGRQALRYRRYAVCADTAEAVRALTGPGTRPPAGPPRPTRAHPVIFMFPAADGPWAGAVHELYAELPEFRTHVDDCAELLAPLLGTDVRDVLRATGTGLDSPPDAALAAPAVFTIEYALARVLTGWGITPGAVLGHGVGEIAAACMAGVFTLGEAVRLAVQHGRATQRPTVTPADPEVEEFARLVRETTLRRPALPLLSAATGGRLTPDRATDPEHWRGRLTGGDRPADCLATAVAQDEHVLVEVGPGEALSELARRQPSCRTSERIVPAMPGQASELRALLAAVGRLWVLGSSVGWRRLHHQRRSLRLPLPTYPFERQNYLLDLAALRRDLQGHAVRVADEPPAGEDVPGRVSEIIAGALGMERVSPEDDFFMLGGDSLVAAQVISRLRRALSVEIPLEVVIEAPTIADVVAGVLAHIREVRVDLRPKGLREQMGG